MNGYTLIEAASSVASIFHAAFAAGFCVGIVTAAIVWWQVAARSQ